MPPEMHGFVSPDLCLGNDDQAASKAGDMWALGEITYQMLTKKPSFRNVAALFAYVQNSSLFPIAALDDNGITTSAIEMLRNLLHTSPKQRLTVEDTVSNMWLAPCRVPALRPPSLASLE